MVSDTYSNILSLMENGNLEVGEEYMITDYHQSLQPILTATETDEFAPQGYAVISGNNWKLYYDFYNNGKYSWSSSKGYIYSLTDPTRNITAPFDWYTTSMITLSSSNINIQPSYVDGVLQRPTYSIAQSTNIEMQGENTGTISISNSSEIIIGWMNNDITIGSSSYVTIGDGNDTVSIIGCTGVTIGNYNYDVEINGGNHVEVSCNNDYISISNDDNIIGCYNRNITVSGKTNEIVNRSYKVELDGSRNTVDRLKNASILAGFNDVKNSETISLDNKSIGNNLQNSKIITLERARNSFLDTDNLYLKDPESFCQYKTVGGVKQFSRTPKQQVDTQIDNNGTVLNIARNATEESMVGDTQYVMRDGTWTVKYTPGKGTKKKCLVEFNIPKAYANYYTFTGDGEYDYNDKVDILATPVSGVGGVLPEITSYFDLNSGARYNATNGALTIDNIQSDIILQPSSTLA